MKLIPPESANWDEVDLHAALARYLADNRMSAEDALCAIVHGLVNDHRENRLAHAGEMAFTLLQGVEVLLRQQVEKNDAIAEQEAGDDAPQDSDFMSGMIRGQLAERQAVVCDLLCDCMKAVGCVPIRSAA